MRSTLRHMFCLIKLDPRARPIGRGFHLAMAKATEYIYLYIEIWMQRTSRIDNTRRTHNRNSILCLATHPRSNTPTTTKNTDFGHWNTRHAHTWAAFVSVREYVMLAARLRYIYIKRWVALLFKVSVKLENCLYGAAAYIIYYYLGQYTCYVRCYIYIYSYDGIWYMKRNYKRGPI